MPTTVREHRCLLISPSDASDERELIEKTATEWNNSVGQFHQLQIRIRRWEADVAPDLRSPGQEVINREIVEEADFGIAVFRLRLGTPTGRFRSGSLEEIEELSKAGKRVLVYLYEGPFEKKEIDHQQLAQLDEEETRLREKGLVASYDSLEDLQEKVRLHLSQILLKDKAAEDRLDDFSNPGLSTATKQDIRLVVRQMIAGLPSGATDFLSVEVQNHSPRSIYTGLASMTFPDGQVYIVPRDYVYRHLHTQTELKPGDSYTFTFDPKNVKQLIAAHGNEVPVVEFRDVIGRVWTADQEKVKNALGSMLK